MPEVALKLIPTVNTESTPTLNESGISSCQFVRFKSGLPQKLGGWAKLFPSLLSGIPRSLHPWQDINGVDHLAIGTTTALYVITDGTLDNITPQTLTSDFAPNFSTVMGSSNVTIIDPNISNITTLDSIFFNTPVSIGGIVLAGVYPITVFGGTHTYEINSAIPATATVNNAGGVPLLAVNSGSSIVTVTLANHGLSVGSAFTFPIPTTVGGITVVGTLQVLTAPSSSTFTISGPTQATSSTSASMNGGNAQLIYYINIGPAAVGTGFGIGGFGSGGFGSGAVPSSQTGTPITATDWTTDNWGSILLACPANGGIYQWAPDEGLQNAGLVSGAPIFNSGIFVAMPQQILVAYGSVSTAQQQDPLTVRWSDILDFTNWTVSTTTQAGSFRIPTGSMIVGALQGPQVALIWTDLAVWAMQYIGFPLVFGFNQLSSGCGLIGPHAAAVMRGGVYWMGNSSFFVLSGGGVQNIPCSVWDVVFQNLDTANQTKCVAGPNSTFDEIWFFFPSITGGTGECDTYVKYNTDENGAWDYGTLPRSAWIDQSVLGQPIATTPSGIVYQHEVSPDADGQPLVWFFQTGYFAITEGQDLAFMDWFFPDMKFGTYSGPQSATVLMTIFATGYPNQAPKVYGPFTLNAGVKFINLRLRNRLISVKFEGSDLGTFARLGNCRYRLAKDGRR